MLRVQTLGTIVHDAAFACRVLGKTALIPVGYEAERAAFLAEPALKKRNKPANIILAYKSPADVSPFPEDDIYFTATVQQSLSTGTTTSTPIFTVTRSDDPAKKRYTGDKSPATVWRAAVEALEADFPDRRELQAVAIRDAKGNHVINGPRLFGYVYSEVMEEVLKLPGAAEAIAAFPPSATAPPTAAAVPKPVAKPAAKRSARGSKAATPALSQQDVEIEMQMVPTINVAGTPSQGTTTTTRKPAEKHTSRAGAAASSSSAAATAPPSQTADCGGGAPAGKKRSRKSSVAAAANDGDASSTTGEAPAMKRARKAPTTAAAAATTDTSSVVCADCDLAGSSPFCSATGRPHAAPACPLCGLTSAFCPNTGQPHAGAVLRPDRARGEVRLPGKTAAPRKRKAATTTTTTTGGGSDTADGVGEVTVIASQGSGTAPDGTTTTTAAKGKKPRAKRARKGAAPAEGQRTLDGSLVAMGTGELSFAMITAQLPPALEEPPKPKEYEYAPLRPPLSQIDQRKAAALLLTTWTETPAAPAGAVDEDASSNSGATTGAAAAGAEAGVATVGKIVLPPHVAALHLPLVAYRVPRPAAANGTGRRGKAAKPAKGSGGGEDGDGSGNEEDTTAVLLGSDNDNEEEGEGEGEGEGNGKKKAAARKPAPKAAPPAVVMIHPLEVREVSTSAAGKRLTKFRLQYTSERTKHDQLRSADTDRKSTSSTTASGKKAAAAAAAAPATQNKEEDDGGEAVKAEDDNENEEKEEEAVTPAGDNEEETTMANTANDEQPAEAAE